MPMKHRMGSMPFGSLRHGESAELESAPQETDPKHPFQPYGRPSLPWLGVRKPLEEYRVPFKERDLFHLGRKLLLHCRFPVLLEDRGFGKVLPALTLRFSSEKGHSRTEGWNG